MSCSRICLDSIESPVLSKHGSFQLYTRQGYLKLDFNRKTLNVVFAHHSCFFSFLQAPNSCILLQIQPNFSEFSISKEKTLAQSALWKALPLPTTEPFTVWSHWVSVTWVTWGADLLSVVQVLRVSTWRRSSSGGMAGAMRCDGDGNTEMHKWVHFFSFLFSTLCVLNWALVIKQFHAGLTALSKDHYFSGV